MYAISRTRDFKKSYQRIKASGKLKYQTKEKLIEIIDALAQGKKLSPVYRDHRLQGELKHYRECHIQGDLLLVYQIRKDELVLILIDIGTHSYLNF